MSTLSMWKFRAISFAVILAVAPFSAASHAQDIEGAMVVNVPFAFESGSQHFTPGLYIIRTEYRGILAIRGKSTSDFISTWFDQDSHPSKATDVVFRRYGDQYFLREVWVAGETSHIYCLPSKAEKREMAAKKTVPTGVTVAALKMPG